MLLIGRGLIQRKKVCADELIFVSNVFGFEGIGKEHTFYSVNS